MRSLLVLLSLLASLASGAPYPFAWGLCKSFEPPVDELSDVMEQARSRMSPTAELKEACFTEESAIVGITQMGVAREERYRFFWATGESYQGLVIIKEGRCNRNRFGRVKCDSVPNAAVVTPASELIYLHGVENARELHELLEFRDRFIGKDFRIIDIYQEVLWSNATTTGQWEYRLLGVTEEEGQISYSVVRRCDAVAECTWQLIGPGPWYY